ncbi:hypothetical protein SUGI_0129470 [Cryptomeria japonica]|uniref:non-specific lipid-transfer protein A n=1 Tax=Cryptomeria japonica TaxID=3369 RepID=UPI002408C3B8|nr:non-specific lipid-transfer protein A [Cryptomeria japonica]GLJ10502.1 hypothetical protein SUGI_0129470 [Cryptomeria japonica]
MGVVQKVLVVGVFAVLFMTTLMAKGTDAVDCNSVVGAVIPCYSFLQTNGMGQPSAQCCSGVKKLATMGKTSAVKRQICSCLKPKIASSPALNNNALNNLPIKCNAGVGFKISKNINCNTL